MGKHLFRIGFCALLILSLLIGTVPAGAAVSDFTVTYDFATLLPGRADGTVTVKAEGYSSEEFTLSWGTEDALLPGYQPVADLSDAKVNKNLLKYTIAAPTGIPAGATHLWVTLDGALMESVEIPEERRPVAETPLYTFGVLSDIHFGTSNAKPAFVAAMESFSANGADFVLSCGDNTCGGTKAQWKEYADSYKPYSDIPLWLVLGNHDALAWNLEVTPKVGMQNAKTYFPNYANEKHSAGEDFTVTVSSWHSEYDYTIEYEGDLYLMMGIGAASNDSENKNIDQRLSEGQLEWLEDCLKTRYAQEDPGKVFLIFHYYTLESGMHVREGTEWDKSSSSKLHRLLNKYPGVIYFNGHTHFAFGEEVNSYADKYASIHVPSSAYSGRFVAGEWDAKGYQGYLVEVYEDYTLIKGTDYLANEIAACAYFRIAEDFSDAVKTYGVGLRTTAGGAVQWRAKGGDSGWTQLATLGDLKLDGSVQSIPYNGKSTIDFRSNQTHIQWRVTGSGDDAWAELIALEDLPKAETESSATDSASETPAEKTPFPVWIPIMVCAVVICVGGAIAAAILLKKKK